MSREPDQPYQQLTASQQRRHLRDDHHLAWPLEEGMASGRARQLMHTSEHRHSDPDHEHLSPTAALKQAHVDGLPRYEDDPAKHLFTVHGFSPDRERIRAWPDQMRDIIHEAEHESMFESGDPSSR